LDAALSDDEGAFQPRPLLVILARFSFPDGNANPKPPKFVGRRKNMMLRSVLARVIVSMAGATPMALAATARAQDPNAYCARVGNDDRVKPIPAAMVPTARRLFNLESADDADFVLRSTVFRCMNGSVWLCNHGANIPCAKADLRRMPPSVTTYCEENPNEAVVPMVVTGHDTIHSWECVGGKARLKQSQKVDPRGFAADQWRRLQ
jgi:hypothetical protein